MKKKKPSVRLSPLDRRLQFHAPSCTVHIYSGDRKCSCGRDEAIEQYRMLLKMAFLFVKFANG